MAAKAKSYWTCQECGFRSGGYMGRCSQCDAWNSLVEEVEIRSARGPAVGVGNGSGIVGRVVPVALDAVELSAGGRRLETGIAELDRVLGGGLVPGGALLLGGDPGIGKSTLAMQMAAAVGSNSAAQGGALYVCGEESASQVALRAERLGVGKRGIVTLSAIDTGSILDAFASLKPDLVIVDSIQTVVSPNLDSAPGSVSQVREASAELVAAAREHGAATVLVGHVTKEGYIAGPRVLEHLVDTVLYFEGDRNHAYRILRAVKNRFGAANEIGVFEMLADGLAEVANPSEVFLGARGTPTSGSVVGCAIEGSRPVLVEIQALVVPSNPGSARRTALGVDHGRVAMLAAVMEKRMGLSMIAQDIFVNTAGGVKIVDPGADLAVIAALASSYLDRPLAATTVVLGEVGLTGEVRPVSQVRARIKEAARLGFGRAVIPQASAEQARAERADIEIAGVASVAEAWQAIDRG